ncbi:MAG: hypothetical protein AB7F99_19115 [Vicinamibacterales bacterium]
MSQSLTSFELTANFDGGSNASPNYPCSLASDWKVVSSIGAPANAVADPITNPGVLSADDFPIFDRPRMRGTTLVVRQAYAQGVTAVNAASTAKVFGAYAYKDENGTVRYGKWQILAAVGGTISNEFAPDLDNDISDGTSRYTTPDPSLHFYDCNGCNVFRIGTEVAFDAEDAGTNDVSSDSYFEAKII